MVMSRDGCRGAIHCAPGVRRVVSCMGTVPMRGECGRDESRPYVVVLV